jgi:hypothetical protein
MIFVLSKDFDWEVKVKSAQFWTEILQQQLVKHEEASHQLLVSLEQHQFFTALQLGLTDYEISVNVAFKPLLLQLAKLLPELKTYIETRSQINQKADNGESFDGSIGSKRHKRQKTEEHVPEYFQEDVDSVIEDIVMAEDSSLVAELENIDPVGKLKQSKAVMAGQPLAVNTVTCAQFLEFCDTSAICWTMEEEGFDMCPEAKMESVLDDILQSVEGVSLVETIDCY